MILIDLGNTDAKIFNGDQKVLNIPSANLYDYLETMQEEQIVICSVVPKLDKQISERYPNVQFINASNYGLMFNNEGQLDSKGADRIIAGYGAVQNFGSKVVVCDIGTCVTVDVIDGREYKGGLIYPGFAMLENLLDEKIDQLPKAKYAISKIETANQIYWANLYGFSGALYKLIEKAMPSEEYQLIITGGSVIRLKEEYNLDLLEELEIFTPIYKPLLIKLGLEAYLKTANK